MPNIFLYTTNLIIFLVAIVFAWITVSKLRNTSATYNARLLPFAYYSFSCWILWFLQYLVLIIRETTNLGYNRNATYEILTSTTGFLAIMQTIVLVIAASSLYSKKPPRLFLILPYLIVISILVAFFSYGMDIFSSPLVRALDAIISAMVFAAFVPSILQLRLSKVFAGTFIIYGICQFVTLLSFESNTPFTIIFSVFTLLRVALLISWTKMIKTLLQRAELSYDKAVKTIKSIELLNPMASFGVMISSTVDDLPQERDAADRAIRALHLDRFRAETFGSLPHAPRIICEFMAQQCDLFILIIAQRNGYVMETEGISVVQFEYEVARTQNPQKILVYVKNEVEREPSLKKFLQKVQDFESGYFRSSFRTPEELYERIHTDVARWLVSQAKQKNVTLKAAQLP
jgi:hypothetical protein